MSELENCPFCNSPKVETQKAMRLDGSFHSWKVWCRSCNCRTGPEKSKSNAMTKWNQRRYKWFEEK